MTDEFNRPAVPVETPIPVPAGAPRLPRRKPRPGYAGGKTALRSSYEESPARFLSSLRSLFRRRGREPAREAKPQIDAVDCTVVAPPIAAPGQKIQLQVYVHRPEQGAMAANATSELDAAAVGRFRRLEIDVERGAALRFRLEMPGLVVEDAAQELIWPGSPAAAQFAIGVPDQSAGTAVNGTAHVDLDTVPIGLVKFRLDVVAGAEVGKQRSEPRGEVAYPFRKAFISFATSDRADVFKRAQMLTQLQIDFFRDVLNLEPRDRWAKGLYQHIDECDLFLLFWSSAARRSEWVLKEARYAVERAARDTFGRPEIRPVLLEGPPFAEPPADLAGLHFDDGLRYFVR
jgi:hypothetical protein